MAAEIRAYARPRRLYRYRALNNPAKLDQELDAIVSHYVYCSSYSDMNDPMEGSHRESALFKDSKIYDRRRHEVENSLATFGIASFSETKEHELMWAHYAGNYSGICIEYNVTTMLKNLPDDHELIRMTYNEQAPMLYRDKQTPDNQAKLILSCKSLKWSGEREWRLMRPETGKACYRDAKAAIGVYLGSRITPEYENEIRSSLGPLKIPVSKMKLDTYALAFEPLRKRIFLKKP